MRKPINRLQKCSQTTRSIFCWDTETVSRFTVSEASKLGIEAKYFENRIELESEILNTIRPEDLVLFKASHDINLGASIDRLFGTDINESSNIAHKKFYLKVQGDFEYYIFETSASVKTYLGTDKRVEIPSHIEAEITDELHNITETRLLSVRKNRQNRFSRKHSYQRGCTSAYSSTHKRRCI